MKTIDYIRNILKPAALLAALLLAAACARDRREGNAPQAGAPIVIGTPAPQDDAEQDDSYLPLVDGKVGLFAAKHTGTPLWNTPSLLMNNVTGTVTSAGGIAYSPTRYYDVTAENYLYDFRAIYPSLPAKGVTVNPATTAKGPTASIKLLDTGGASPTPYYQEVMFAAADDAEKGSDGVPMKFRHLLTEVVVKVSKDATQVPQSAFLHDIRIEGLSIAEADLVTGELAHYGGHMDVSILEPGARDYEIGSVPKEVCRVLMLPMAASPESSYYLKFKINERFGMVRIPQYADDSQSPPVVQQEWKPGYSYTYELKVVDADIILVLDAGINRDEWIDENLPPITIF